MAAILRSTTSTRECGACASESSSRAPTTTRTEVMRTHRGHDGLLVATTRPPPIMTLTGYRRTGDYCCARLLRIVSVGTMLVTHTITTGAR